MTARFSKVRPGEPVVIRADTWNALMDLAKSAQAPDQLAVRRPPSGRPSKFCRIREQGPAGEDDFPDARYWVEEEICNNTSGDDTEQRSTDVLSSTDESLRYFMATNEADIDGDHDLLPGTGVHVFWDEDQSSPPRRRYWFVLSSAMILLLGGHFNAVGSVPADGVATWNGKRWVPFISTVEPGSPILHDVALFQDELYFCGTITLDTGGGPVGYAVVKWDGTDWVGVLPDNTHVGTPRCMTVYGGELWVGGEIGGGATPIASFDGLSWTDRSGPESTVRYMMEFGGDLYAVGNFELCGGVTANSIAVWDGTAWSPVGDGLLSGGVYGTGLGLALHDDGDGEGLYVCGAFDEAGGVADCNGVARYRGGLWSRVGDGISGTVNALCSVPGDEQDILYAATSRLYWYDGAAWATVGEVLSQAFGFPAVRTLAVFRDALHLGGAFDYIATREYDAQAGRVARSKLPGADEFEALGTGVNAAVRSLVIYDGRLVAAGDFTPADGAVAERIARWNHDDGVWEPWTSFSASIRAMYEFGGNLYVGGSFTFAAGLDAARLIRYTGAGWFTFGGVNGPVYTIGEFGGKIIIGGRFTLHDGAPPVNANAIISYDPTGGAWAAFDDGFTRADGDAIVRAVVEYDGDLYACGRFDEANGVPCANIAMWDGAAWQPLGGGLNGEARCMAVFGGELYVGGAFTDADGTTVRNIARWDGAAWAVVGSTATSPSEPVDSMIVYDDGGGDDLYVDAIDLGTIFVPGTGLHRVRRWSGSAWSYLDGSFNGNVLAMAVGDSGDGTDRLHCGGEFTGAGDADLQTGPANRVLRFDQDGLRNIGGGIGWNPRVALGVDGGDVSRLRVIEYDGKTLLYAVGRYQVASDVLAESIAKLTSRGFKAMGRGLRGAVNTGAITHVTAVLKHDDGTGLALYATGNFSKYVNEANGVTSTGAAAGVARFKDGLWGGCGAIDNVGQALARFPAVLNLDATLSGTNLVSAAADTFADNMVGAAITVTGGTGGNAGTYFIATAIDSANVEITGVWPGTVPDDVTITVDTLDLYAAGWFSDYVRRWNGSDWLVVGNLASLASGFAPFSMVQFDGLLWVAGPGASGSVWTWDGSAWDDMSPSDGSQGYDLLVVGADLYLAAAGSGTAVLKKWNGSGWTDMGTATGEAKGIAVLIGPNRIAAYGAINIGGTLYDLAVWDGATWTPIGTITGDGAEAIMGKGATLWLGGSLGGVDSVRVRELVRWDGTDWSAHPRGGANSPVFGISRGV